jgi:hypothetical protein
MIVRNLIRRPWLFSLAGASAFFHLHPFLMLPGQNRVVNPATRFSDNTTVWPALGCADHGRHVCRGRRRFPALPGRREDDAFTNP